jgi:spore coat protein U-like protein
VQLLRAISAACLLAASLEASAACTVSATGPAFGTYDPFASAPLDAAGAVNFQCTAGPVPVFISAGNSGTYSARAMRSGTAILSYNLYTNAARTLIWGDGTGGTSYLSAQPGRPRSLPVFGRIPALQDAGPGAYADTLVVTFNF